MANRLTKDLTGFTLPTDIDAADVIPIYDLNVENTKKVRIDQLGSVPDVYTGVLNSATNLISTSTDGSVDTLIFNDANDSNKAKKRTISGFIDDIYWRILNKISSLDTAGTLTGSDELVISQSNAAKKVTFTTLSNDISSGVFDKIDDIATELTAPAKDDYVVVSDTSDSGTGKKMVLRRLFSSWSFAASVIANPTIILYGNNNTTDVNRITFANFLTSVFGKLPPSTTTTVATTDYVGYSDTASGTGKKITFANFIKSVFGGITNQTSKATPVGADEIVIADSASSGAAKKTTLTQLAATSLFTASSLAAIHSQTEKATVVDADEFVINDSAASWGVKKTTFTTLLTWILSKYQNIFDKADDLTEYTGYMTPNYDYLVGIDSDTGTAVKVLPKSVYKEHVSSTTLGVSIEGVLGYGTGVLLVDATSGNKTISLPAAATYKYIRWSVKKIDGSANTVIIDPNASETIDGAATYVLSSQYSTVTFISDGSAWYII